jgi:hypothetical protein
MAETRPTDDSPYRAFAPTTPPPPRAPRKIPVGITLQLIFGGRKGIGGWVLAVASAVALWFVLPRTDLSDFTSLAVMAMTLAALVLIVTNLIQGLRTLELLARGFVARGKLTSKVRVVRVESKLKGPLVYRLVFDFETATGARASAAFETSKPAVLEDEPTQQLVYDPREPSRAVLMEFLPGSPRIDVSDHCVPTSPHGVTSALGGPVAFVVVNLLMAAVHFLA